MKVKNDHRSKFSNWKEEAWKNQGFNGIQTRVTCTFTAMIIFHFHLLPQFKNELFHLYFT